MNELKSLTLNGVKYDSFPDKTARENGGEKNAVLYTKQTLTDEQKAQARKNIGVVISGNINYDLNVRAVNHRGYSTEAPENTIPAYILSKQKGFTYVECDIAFTSDNVAVLLHDNTIDRTSDGSGSIAAMAYETVSQYDFGSWKSSAYAGTKIPTFEEFIMLCKSIVLHPYIELKSSGAYTEEQIAGIVSTVKAYGMEGKVTYISFNSTFLGYVKTADSKARLGYLADITTSTIATALGLKTEENEVFMDVSYSNLTSEKVTMCIENDLPLEIWTVNEESIIANMDAYITGVTSDNIIAGKVLYEKYITVEPEPEEPEVPEEWIFGKFHFNIKQGKMSGLATDKYIQTSNTTRVSYVGTACTLIPGNKYRLVGQTGVRYGVNTITQSGLAKIMSNTDLAESYAGQNSVDKLDSGWQTTGYEFIADTNAACAWLTASFESGNITPNQAMPVYLEYLGVYTKPEPDWSVLPNPVVDLSFDSISNNTITNNGTGGTQYNAAIQTKNGTAAVNNGALVLTKNACANITYAIDKTKQFAFYVEGNHDVLNTTKFQRLFRADTDALCVYYTHVSNSGEVYSLETKIANSNENFNRITANGNELVGGNSAVLDNTIYKPNSKHGYLFVTDKANDLIYVYIDGTKFASQPLSLLANISYIGMGENGASSWYADQISINKFMIWDVEFTEDEIERCFKTNE